MFFAADWNNLCSLQSYIVSIVKMGHVKSSAKLSTLLPQKEKQYVCQGCESTLRAFIDGLVLDLDFLELVEIDILQA